MELKELCENVLDIFGVEDMEKLGDALMLCCKENDEKKLEQVERLTNDLSVDYFQKIFQYYYADRKEKKQDYTPKTLAKLVGKLAGEADTVIDMCAGSGSLTIAKWHLNRGARFKLFEIDERVIPFLLFNLILRNIEATVLHADVLQMETYHKWRTKKGEKYGVLEVVL